MAYETEGLVFLIIIILIAIIIIILLIYYSCGAYNDIDDDIDDNKNNTEIIIPNINVYPEIKNNDISEFNCLDETKNIVLSTKNCDKINCQDVTDDVSIRGKSVFDFMTTKIRPGVIKILKKELIDDNVENGKLIQFEGSINHMIQLPFNPDSGLTLNLFNNSSVIQTFNSKMPILKNKNSFLKQNINPDKFLMIIYNGSEWIIPNYSENDNIDLPINTTNKYEDKINNNISSIDEQLKNILNINKIIKLS